MYRHTCSCFSGFALIVGILIGHVGGAWQPLSVNRISTTSTALPHADLPVITLANAYKIQELSSIGRGYISSVVWSPDGSVLAVSGPLGVWVYNSRDFNATPQLFDKRHQPVGTLFFDRDGTLLTLTDSDVWDIRTGETKIKINDLQQNVREESLSPDKKVLLTSIGDYQIHLWNLQTGGPIATVAGSATAFSPDSHLLATGGEDNVIRLWDAKTGKIRAALSGHHGSVLHLAFNPSGTLLASSSWDNTIRLWDVTTATEIKTLIGHTSGVDNVAFNADGTLLASTSGDGTMRFWNVKTGNAKAIFNGHNRFGGFLSFSPDGTLLATNEQNSNEISIWDVKQGTLHAALDGYLRVNGGSNLTLTDDASLIAVASDSDVQLWNIQTGIIHKITKPDNVYVYGVAINADGTRVATLDEDSRIRLWDAISGDEQAIFGQYEYWADSVLFTPDGKLLASGDHYDMRLWDVQTGREIARCGAVNGVGGMAFSADGKQLAFSNGFGVVVWNLKDGDEGTTLSPVAGNFSLYTGVAFSPDGTLVAAGSQDGNVYIYDMERNQRVFIAHTREVTSVAFSQDGTVLASASIDGTIRLWNVKTGQIVNILYGHRGAVTTLIFSKDGRQLFSGGDDTIRIWGIA